MEGKSRIKSKKEGITVIALIVSIVVMIILAGVIFAIAFGEENVIREAKNATNVNAKSELLTKLRMLSSAARVKAVRENRENDLENYIEKVREELKQENGYIIEGEGENQTVKLKGQEDTKILLKDVYENKKVALTEISERRKSKDPYFDLGYEEKYKEPLVLRYNISKNRSKYYNSIYVKMIKRRTNSPYNYKPVIYAGTKSVRTAEWYERRIDDEDIRETYSANDKLSFYCMIPIEIEEGNNIPTAGGATGEFYSGYISLEIYDSQIDEILITDDIYGNSQHKVSFFDIVEFGNLGSNTGNVTIEKVSSIFNPIRYLTPDKKTGYNLLKFYKDSEPGYNDFTADKYGYYTPELFGLVPEIQEIDFDLYFKTVSKSTFENLKDLRRVKKIKTEDKSIPEGLFASNNNLEVFGGFLDVKGSFVDPGANSLFGNNSRVNRNYTVTRRQSYD